MTTQQHHIMETILLHKGWILVPLLMQYEVTPCWTGNFCTEASVEYDLSSDHQRWVIDCWTTSRLSKMVYGNAFDWHGSDQPRLQEYPLQVFQQMFDVLLESDILNQPHGIHNYAYTVCIKEETTFKSTMVSPAFQCITKIWFFSYCYATASASYTLLLHADEKASSFWTGTATAIVLEIHGVQFYTVQTLFLQMALCLDGNFKTNNLLRSPHRHHRHKVIWFLDQADSLPHYRKRRRILVC